MACWTNSAIAEEPLRTAATRRIDIHHLRLDVDLDLPKKHLKGQATIAFSPLPAFFEAARQPVIELDAHALDVSAVRLRNEGASGTDADFALTDDKLQITAPQGAIKPGQKYEVEIDYSVTDPPSGLHFFGPTEQAPNVPLMVWSQGEPQANHYWFPCIDNSNERQSTELIVNVASGIDVLSY